jgi:hypothetical protein
VVVVAALVPVALSSSSPEQAATPRSAMHITISSGAIIPPRAPRRGAVVRAPASITLPLV